jgi:sporulation-control protein spo0M
MADTVTLKLSQDELEIVSDALEADMEGYLEAAKEARGRNNAREEVATFSEAATRIQAVLSKVQALVEDED